MEEKKNGASRLLLVNAQGFCTPKHTLLKGEAPVHVCLCVRLSVPNAIFLRVPAAVK